MLFGQIKRQREISEKTQEEIADYLGISQTVYSRYERCLRTIPVDHLIKLADYYNVSIDYLLGQTENPSRH
ncbi:MAG: helix-turn-helix transcriptional regulator [Clostridia bacterium]|nr:helix-turn-helix transcriptional regulator [Clostridia bacterium]